MTAGQRFLAALGGITIAGLLLAGLGVLPWNVLVFYLGLLLQLYVAAYNFVLLLFPIGKRAA